MPAPMFPANAHKFDPYRTFKFTLAIGGKPVAGLSKMGALVWKAEVAKWRAGGDRSTQQLMPGGISFEAITLEQGLSHDPIFEEWANAVNNLAEGDGGISLKNFRRTLSLSVLNPKGTPAITYILTKAWVSEFHALPELDANNMNTVGIEKIMIVYEKFVRDTGIAEPVET